MKIVKMICPETKRMPTSVAPSVLSIRCTCCTRPRELVPDFKAEERYEVCTQCGHPRLLRDNSQCCGNHELPAQFTWLNAVEHRNFLKTIEEIIPE